MYNNHLKKREIIRKILLKKNIKLSSSDIDRLMLSLDMLNYGKQYTESHNKIKNNHIEDNHEK
tara:strand:+ start:1421 stop:1609 length:189 start_codon:yes stop_codon:yes gene_type:complete